MTYMTSFKPFAYHYIGTVLLEDIVTFTHVWLEHVASMCELIKQHNNL